MRDDILENIVDRMSNDADFLKQLETKPGKALVEAGLTWEEIAEIKQTAESPTAEALGERSSAAFTAIGKLWYDITGQCGCESNWVTGASTGANVPFCT